MNIFKEAQWPFFLLGYTIVNCAINPLINQYIVDIYNAQTFKAYHIAKYIVKCRGNTITFLKILEFEFYSR